MSYTINLSIKKDDNDTLSVVEKTCWYYSGGADWTEREGHHILSLKASGTSGMLRFRTSTGESFCLAVGVHNYSRWCDIIVDAGDDDTAVRIHPAYYSESNPRNQMLWNQLSSLERTTATGRTLTIKFFRDDGHELFAT
ncbi:fruit body lectin, partial [Lojkania enalia]